MEWYRSIVHGMGLFANVVANGMGECSPRYPYSLKKIGHWAALKMDFADMRKWPA
jgi:hypothetical protein